MNVVILLGGDDLPQVYGPFDTEDEARAFIQRIPKVWVPCITEVESPQDWEEE